MSEEISGVQAAQHGVSAYNRKDWITARHFLEIAVAADREQYDLARCLARSLAHLNEVPASIEILEYIAAKQPDHASTAWLLANGYSETGRHADAFAMYERCRTLAPNTPAFEWSYAHWMTNDGQYLNGLRAFEWGYYCKQRIARSTQPEWSGKHCRNSREVLYIAGEMGLGDHVLYGRYVREAKRRWGAIVVLEMHDVLVPLYTKDGLYHLDTGADSVVTCTEFQEPRVRYDEWVNIGSLPAVLFGTDTEMLAVNGYSLPDKTPHEGVNVGLAWKGAPNNPIDRTRSMPLEMLLPLLNIPGITFFNLQYGAEIPSIVPIVQLDITRTDKLAFAISNMDAVVSVDTLVANIAATIGVPTHVLATLQSDYRWHGPDENTSAMYPSAVVHRQRAWMDWDEPLREIKKALMALGGNDG